MSVKRLSVTMPPIVGLHYHAYPLSVAFNYEKFLPWFYCHYIQVFCSKNFSEPNGSSWLNFVSFDLWNNGIPFISDNHLLDRQSIVDNKIDIVNYVINYTNRGWYTYVEVDDFYIPFRNAYQKYRQPHDLFIFGYDINNKTFDVAGFNSEDEFSYDKLSFEDFEKAYHYNDSNICDIDTGSFNFIRTFKVLDDWEYEFDLKLFVELLDDYINSIDTTEKFRMYRTPANARVYGMEVYQVLKEYYKLLLRNEIEFDIRPIHLLWEHKKCMSLRIKYIVDTGLVANLNSAYDDYREIEQKLLNARNLMLKYEVTNDAKSLTKIISILEEVENEERKQLIGIQEKIKKQI